MSAPGMIGKGPVWTYGANASFGLWAQALSDSRMWVALYKGVLFKRKTTFLWKTTVKEVEGASGAPNHEVDLTFKQKLEPELTVVRACGAIVPRADFPITVFECEGSVIYSDDDMSSFKKLAVLPESTFYTADASGAGAGFTLPDVDTEIYEDKAATVEDTKKGLLVPLWRIDVDVSSTRALTVSEVLDLRTADTFAFAEYEEEPEGETGGTGGEEDPCDPDGGGDAADDTEEVVNEDGTEGSLESNDPGAPDENGEGGLQPCP